MSVTEKSSQRDEAEEANAGESKNAPDALESFLQNQSKKCAAHHRTHTSEVLELIRKHRKT